MFVPIYSESQSSEYLILCLHALHLCYNVNNNNTKASTCPSTYHVYCIVDSLRTRYVSRQQTCPLLKPDLYLAVYKLSDVQPQKVSQCDAL